MKNLFIILFIFNSCISDHQSTDDLVKKFEYHLGEPETTLLNEIIKDFDQFINKSYRKNDSTSSFKQYLIDISQTKSKKILKKLWLIDSTKLIKYRKSKLFATYDTIYPDSVWYSKKHDWYNVKYKSLDLIENRLPITNFNDNIDSVIIRLKREPYVRIKSNSTFYIALDSIRENNILIKEYMEAIEAVGNISINIMAQGLLSTLNDSSEYYAKRIFIIDSYTIH